QLLLFDAGPGPMRARRPAMAFAAAVRRVGRRQTDLASPGARPSATDSTLRSSMRGSTGTFVLRARTTAERVSRRVRACFERCPPHVSCQALPRVGLAWARAMPALHRFGMSTLSGRALVLAAV